jgi:hypothetical protein
MLQRICCGFAHTQPAGAVRHRAAGQLAQAIGSLMDGRDYHAPLVNRQSLPDAVAADPLQMGGLVQHRVRLDQHEPREKRADPRPGQRSAAELGKGMVPAIGRNNIVPRLRSAVESDNGANIAAAGQIVDDRPFAAIAVSETDDDCWPG